MKKFLRTDIYNMYHIIEWNLLYHQVMGILFDWF